MAQADHQHSLGYFPGHIVRLCFLEETDSDSLSQHAFWLIYKKMQAEEKYGYGGFHCTYFGYDSVQLRLRL